jgi:hypothetical protein
MRIVPMHHVAIESDLDYLNIHKSSTSCNNYLLKLFFEFTFVTRLFCLLGLPNSLPYGRSVSNTVSHMYNIIKLHRQHINSIIFEFQQTGYLINKIN